MFQVVEPSVKMPEEDVVIAIDCGSVAGLEFHGYFADLGDVRRNHTVLDIGCGVGRMADPLMFYLESSARYLGFDVVRKSIDFAFLTSVFTHMFGDQIRHDLDELVRVLRPGGTILMTCFLLNPEVRGMIGSGLAKFDFAHPMGGGHTQIADEPEGAIASRKTISENGSNAVVWRFAGRFLGHGVGGAAP